jgi:hypothetical protein
MKSVLLQGDHPSMQNTSASATTLPHVNAITVKHLACRHVFAMLLYCCAP